MPAAGPRSNALAKYPIGAVEPRAVQHTRRTEQMTSLAQLVGDVRRGGNNLKGVSGENIVALCDVDMRRAGRAFKSYPRAKHYRDFRKMLDEMDNQIDAVVVSTPDHTHAVASMEAIKRGKHVYCEKPLAHSIYEVRKLTEAARKYKVATQMGNKGHSSEHIRLCCEWVADGAIGNVRQVHAWSNRPMCGYAFPSGLPRPKDTPTVPDTLNWDLWLGRQLRLRRPAHRNGPARLSSLKSAAAAQQ